MVFWFGINNTQTTLDTTEVLFKKLHVFNLVLELLVSSLKGLVFTS